MNKQRAIGLINPILTDIACNHGVEISRHLSAHNSADLQIFANTLGLEHDTESAAFLIESHIKEHYNKDGGISADDIKSVYAMLQRRQLNPPGEFDKAGRFYLDDNELVDVRSPSAKYPYSQMHAGRTMKFVKAMALKYSCANVDELISYFH